MASELYRTSEKQETSKWTLRNVVTFFFLIAAFVLLIIGEDKWLSREKIPSTFLPLDAVVVSSNIESNSIEGKDGRPTVFYSAIITYEYRVKGEMFTSRHTLGNVSRNDYAPSQIIVATYSPGAVIPIVYNPVNPGESRINVSSFPGPFFYIIAGILCFVLTALSYLFIPEPQPRQVSSTGKQPVNNKTDSHESDITKDIYAEKIPSSLPPEAMGLIGKWKLLYQVPSMREILSASRTEKSAMGFDTTAVMSAGAESLTIIIDSEGMEFIYMDSKLQGSCDIVSRYTCEGNRLDLEHISMDFIIADVEGFPPTSYNFELKDSKLTLKSTAIKGLGGRGIVYILQRVETKE